MVHNTRMYSNTVPDTNSELWFRHHHEISNLCCARVLTGAQYDTGVQVHLQLYTFRQFAFTPV
eukprot:COSAG02_NODE_31692_length_529_cov_0.644186_1_plen_62_part_10